MNPPDYIQRVVDEKRELDEKRKKLAEFRTGSAFVGLSQQEQELLNAQAQAMTVYSAVLGERVRVFFLGAPA